MQNKIISQSLSTLRIIAISSLTIFTLYTVQAWVSPTQSPPNGNVSGPITTSSVAQTKAGDLTVSKITAPSHCIGTSCITAWPSGGGVTSVNGQTGAVSIATGDNLGNHSMTTTLYTNGNQISHSGGGYALVSPSGPIYAPYIVTTGQGSGAYGVGLILQTGQGAGKVLTSDANGYGSWQTPAGGGVTSVNGMTGAVTVPAGSSGAALFGGSYLMWNNACYRVNLATGACSCPSGYTAGLVSYYAGGFTNAGYVCQQ